jgi:HEAT repeat protein
VARAISKIGGKRAVDSLIGTLKDRRAILRERAVWALGQLGDPEALTALISVANNDMVTVRTEAIKALGEFTDDSALDTLLGIVLDDKDRDARIEAARTAARIGNPRALYALDRVKYDDDVYVRRAVEKAIAALEKKQRYFG